MMNFIEKLTEWHYKTFPDVSDGDLLTIICRTAIKKYAIKPTNEIQYQYQRRIKIDIQFDEITINSWKIELAKFLNKDDRFLSFDFGNEAITQMSKDESDKMNQFRSALLHMKFYIVDIRR